MGRLVSFAAAIAVVTALASSADAGTSKPRPATAAKAIALVRSNQDTSRAASPYKRELGWVAEWRDDRWWVAGVFESQWAQRFVVDAAIVGGRVRTYVNYDGRPTKAWIYANTRRWKLATLYTRFTAAAAIASVRQDVGLGTYTVLGSAARIAKDSAGSVAWYFVFYVQTADGSNLVLPVTGPDESPAVEGNYIDGYGFGSQPQLQQSVPLNLSDWIRGLASARGWHPSNL